MKHVFSDLPLRELEVPIEQPREIGQVVMETPVPQEDIEHQPSDSVDRNPPREYDRRYDPWWYN